TPASTKERDGFPVGAARRFHADRPARTTSTTSAASGRYMRRSAPTSLAMGTTLVVGASVRKKAAHRKPTLGQRTNATAVASNSEATTAMWGRTSRAATARGRP